MDIARGHLSGRRLCSSNLSGPPSYAHSASNAKLLLQIDEGPLDVFLFFGIDLAEVYKLFRKIKPQLRLLR